MEFRRRQWLSNSPPQRVALVPGSYNPPTNAHRALIESAFDYADEVVAVMPRTLPHKTYEGVALEDRMRMLEHVSVQPYSIAISEGGLFLEICEEFQRAAGPSEVSIACGRDAAERILTWDYGGDPSALDRMFENFGLLVAARQGDFDPPARYRERIRPLGIGPAHDSVSSTEVRERIRAGLDWRHLVPEMVVPLVEHYY